MMKPQHTKASGAQLMGAKVQRDTVREKVLSKIREFDKKRAEGKYDELPKSRQAFLNAAGIDPKTLKRPYHADLRAAADAFLAKILPQSKAARRPRRRLGKPTLFQQLTDMAGRLEAMRFLNEAAEKKVEELPELLPGGRWS